MAKSAQRWEPRTNYNKDDRFIFKGVTYRVLEALVTGLAFDDNDSRYIEDYTQVIANITINSDDRLIVTYDDGTTADIGAVGGGSGSANLVTERLIVTGTNVLSTPNYQIDTTKPVKLYINHLVYASINVPTLFNVAEGGITWIWTEAQSGFDLVPSDNVFIDYTRIP